MPSNTTPSEFTIPVAAYRNVDGTRSQGHGIINKEWKELRFGRNLVFFVKVGRVRVGNQVVAHQRDEYLRMQLIGWWADFANLRRNDILVVNPQNPQPRHFELSGPPINWNEMNKFGLINALSAYDCKNPDCTCGGPDNVSSSGVVGEDVPETPKLIGIRSTTG